MKKDKWLYYYIVYISDKGLIDFEITECKYLDFYEITEVEKRKILSFQKITKKEADLYQKRTFDNINNEFKKKDKNYGKDR